MDDARLGRLRLRQLGTHLPPLPSDDWRPAGTCEGCGGAVERRAREHGDDDWRCLNRDCTRYDDEK